MKNNVNVRKEVQSRALGDKLRELRVKRKLTVAAASRKCGMDPTNYGNIEKGHRAVRVDTLMRILEVLGYQMIFAKTAGPRKAGK